MQIKSATYRVLYLKLWDRFREREVTDGFDPKRYSPSLWKITNSRKQFIVIEKILGETAFTDPRYFYRKFIELEPLNKVTGELDDMVVCKALEYLGFQVPKDLKNRDHLHVRRENLFRQFVQAYMPDYNIENEEIKEVEESPAKGTEILVRQIEDIKALLNKYYELIAASEYVEAWKLMSPEFQNRLPWQGEVSRFIEGYSNTTGVREVYVFNILQRFPSVIEAQVYYEDEIAAYSSTELTSIFSMTIADLEHFMKNVQALQKKVDEAGGQHFERIELYKLFEQGASEYIWYKCGIKPSDIEALFPFRKTILVKRLYYCTCKLINDKWYINSIRGVGPQSAR